MHYTTPAELPAQLAKAGTESSRLPFVDALRAAASTTILLHHLTYFGPVSDWALPAAPHLITWLFDYGAMAVQIFLVLGGFMTARSLAGRTFGWREAASFAAQRYCRLALPYLAMLVVAIAAAAWARPWLPEEDVGLPPSTGQLVSHVFLLQFILGYDRLSAGVWYVCVDFQLGLLLVGLLLVRDWMSRLFARPLPGLPMLLGWILAAAALFYFNRNPVLNMWAFYFFGSYFLGVLVHYELAGRRPPVLLILYVLMMAAALTLQWRTRLAVATTTGLLLYVSGRLEWLERWPRSRVIEYLGRISYSLFLIHFSVLLVVYALWVRMQWTSPTAALAGMVLIYPLSLLAAIAFYHGVETPCVRLSRRLRLPRSPSPAPTSIARRPVPQPGLAHPTGA